MSGVPQERITLVHPGCDADLFRPHVPDLELRRRLLGERVNDRVLLTVGNLVPRKGHDMVIRALPSVLRSVPNVTYLVVSSDFRNFESLDKLAREVGVRDRLVFASDVAMADLPRVYGLCDLFVMPSRAVLEKCDVEGFGIVFLEAAACEKPVIAGRSGGIPDAVLDGETGLLVDPHSADEIASCIVRLLEDPSLCAALGARGRARVVNELTWSHVGQRVQDAVETLE